MSNPGSKTGGQTRKRVAQFLDGTWNTVGDNTNVWRLEALCAARSTDGALGRLLSRPPARNRVLSLGLSHSSAGADDRDQSERIIGSR